MSLESDERELRASLGLHRGRRVVGAAVVLVVCVALLALVRDDAHSTPPVSEVVLPPSAAPLPSRAPTPRRSRGTPSAHPQKPLRAAAPASSATATPEPHASSALEVAAPIPESSEPAAAPVVPAPEPDALLVAAVPVAPEPEPDVTRLAAAPAPEGPPAEPPSEPAAPAAWDGNGESIARAIADAKRAAVRACFERELKRQPKLAGTVVVELDLAAPNRIEALRVSDDLNRPEFTRCVTAAMQGVRFAALDEDISVRVPYVLSPVKR